MTKNRNYSIITGLNFKRYSNIANKITKKQENWLVSGHGKKSAAECIKCGKCEEVCPQHIQIRDELAKTAKAMA